MRWNECIDRLEFNDKSAVNYKIGDEISNDVPIVKYRYGLLVFQGNLFFSELQKKGIHIDGFFESVTEFAMNLHCKPDGQLDEQVD